MIRQHLRWLSFLLFIGIFTLPACSTPPTGNDGGTTETPVGTPDGSTTQDDGTSPQGDDVKPTGKWPPPSGYAAISIQIDDTNNKTYKDGQLLWNGSFKYDENTNTVVYASAWQPTDGPFPPLYDDGPIDQGGHEPIGSKKGDNIFGIVVFVKPDAEKDLEFEYGLINEDQNWLWEGSNGKIVVKKGATDEVKAKGMKIPAHGSIDLKITLNVNDMPDTFFDKASPPPIFVKGNMSNWGIIQAHDKGKKGDDKAGDKIFTYVQKENLGFSPHLGLLAHERHVQFVFQFHSASGREYKDADEKAIAKGVNVWADCNGDGKFTDDEKQKIIWEKDSRGAVENTTVVVCEGKEAPCTKNDCDKAKCKDKAVCKGCKDDKDCGANETCDTTTGKCNPKSTGCTKSDCATTKCKDDPVCKCKGNADCDPREQCDAKTGKCVPKQKCKDDKDCPPDHTCETSSGRCLLQSCTAKDCQTNRCKNDPVCTNSKLGPVLHYIIPSVGPRAGGTLVTLSGNRFQKTAKVQFGGKDATDIQWKSATQITCKTPPASTNGEVDVTVVHTDGLRSTYPLGFKYDDSAVTRPQIISINPNRTDIKGGELITIKGRNFKANAKVLFAQKAATDVQVKSATEITCKNPSYGAGKVSVTVENSDGTKDTLIDGFEYFEKFPKVDWARLVHPKTLSGAAGAQLGPIYCQGYDAALKTKDPGGAKGLIAQTGWGPLGSKPETWPAGNWKAMTFNKDIGNNDEYQGTISVSKAGRHNYACRMSVDGGKTWLYADTDQAGTNNGYDATDAGVVTVSDPNTLGITRLEPAFGAAKGGEQIKIHGSGFQSGTTVKFGNNSATQVKVVSKVLLEVTVPAGSVGRVGVTVSHGGKSDTLQNGFAYTGTGASVGWCKLQWPPTIPYPAQKIPAAKVGSPSPNIYGQVWKNGVTNGAGPGKDIVGHVGYGPTGSDPSTDTRWKWFPTTFNKQDGNNDEWAGQVTISQKGTYSYAFRFSGDGGIRFWYCDATGNTSSPAQNFRKDKAGKITAQ